MTGILNEPDLKIPGADGLKAVISAWDGMLAAEEEAGVARDLCKFTVTWSFDVCHGCETAAEGAEPARTAPVKTRPNPQPASPTERRQKGE